MRGCYELGLAKNPKLGGRVDVQFAISAEGRVGDVAVSRSTLNHPQVESCLVSTIRRWKFPKPTSGGIVIVTYPFEFQPDTSE